VPRICAGLKGASRPCYVMEMLAFDDGALARLMIAATAIAPHERGHWLRMPSTTPPRRNAIRMRH